MLTQFNAKIAQKIFNSKEKFPVKFDNAWQWLEYDRKDSAKRYLIDNLEEDIDFRIYVELGTLAVPRPSENILLSIEGFKNWGMMSKTPVGKQIRRYFMDCESRVKAAKASKGVEWDLNREAGKPARLEFTDTIHSFQPTSRDYAIATNQTYLGLIGQTAAEIKLNRGLKKSQPARDGLTSIELAAVRLTELAVASVKMESLNQLNKTAFQQAQAISKAILVS
jgi:phage anti-repressor protein